MAACVETRFRALRNGRRVPDVVVRIGQPRRTHGGEWACTIQATGITRKTIARGVDALQALCIAIDFLGEKIYKARTKGLRLTFDTGEPTPLQAYFRLRESRRRLVRMANKLG